MSARAIHGFRAGHVVPCDPRLTTCRFPELQRSPLVFGHIACREHPRYRGSQVIVDHDATGLAQGNPAVLEEIRIT